MKFTLSWLKEHLDTDAGVAEVAETLTRIGLEVEGIEDPAAKLAAFTIAEVLTAERHPQADKLQVLSVDTGAGDPVQVVCGAPNARAGMKGVFGAPGTYVPGSDITLKVAAIRGVESRGMMCSMRELELSEEHDGIIELPADAPGRRALCRLCRARRPGVRRRHHAQPAGLHGRARHRARPRRRRARPAEAADRGLSHRDARRAARRRRRRTSGPTTPKAARPSSAARVTRRHQRRRARLDAGAS